MKLTTPTFQFSLFDDKRLLKIPVIHPKIRTFHLMKLSMRTAYSIILLGALAVLSAAEISMSSAVQTIYSRSPKLRLKGTGFGEVDESDIRVEIGSSGQPLKQGKDFVVTKGEDGIILKLLTSRK